MTRIVVWIATVATAAACLGGCSSKYSAPLPLVDQCISQIEVNEGFVTDWAGVPCAPGNAGFRVVSVGAAGGCPSSTEGFVINEEAGPVSKPWIICQDKQ